MAREIYGSISGEGQRIDEFAEILNEELNSSSIRVKRESQFEWKVRTGINTRGKLRIYRSGSNIIYEGKVGYNYALLALSLILTVALVIVSLFFIYYGIFFSLLFIFIFLSLGDVERLEYEVKKSIEEAINKLLPQQPTDLSLQERKDKQAGFEPVTDRYCVYCGRQITPDMVYCPRCGNRIS
ncbi:MAG: zinc-ribbon domain-containing protein [Candidatus Jordarchaeaceae archaeon]